MCEYQHLQGAPPQHLLQSSDMRMINDAAGFMKSRDGGWGPSSCRLTDGKSSDPVRVWVLVQGPRVPARPGARTCNAGVLRCRRWRLLEQDGPSSGFKPERCRSTSVHTGEADWRLLLLGRYQNQSASLDKFTRQYDQKLRYRQNNPSCRNIAVRRHKTCFNANMLITLLEKKDEVM